MAIAAPSLDHTETKKERKKECSFLVLIMRFISPTSADHSDETKSLKNPLIPVALLDFSVRLWHNGCVDFLSKSLLAIVTGSDTVDEVTVHRPSLASSDFFLASLALPIEDGFRAHCASVLTFCIVTRTSR